MFDVGDTVTLTTSPRDSEGNPLDVDQLKLRLTLPDSTIVGPFTPSGGDGDYAYDYTTVQAGRHVTTWSGVGYADSDVFNVWPADPRFLISLDDARRARRTTSTCNDDELRLYIAAVTPVIEDIVGPVGTQTYTVTRDGGTPAIVLPHSNVTIQSVDVNGQAFTNFTPTNTAGVLTYGTGYTRARWPHGVQNISVTYTAGLAAVPANILLAASEEFRFLWQIGHEGQGLGFGVAPDDTEFTPSGYAVPRRVIELCAPHQLGPVVA